MKKLLIIVAVLCSTVAAANWSDWKEISPRSITFEVDAYALHNNVTDEKAWRSDANFEGKNAFHVEYLRTTETDEIFIQHVKFPEGWVINGTDNDRKYLISLGEQLVPGDINPLDNLRKKNIKRLRSSDNKVTAHVFYNGTGNKSNCMIFFKEYFKADSGFTTSTSADEVLAVQYCSSKTINPEEIINSVFRK